MPLPTRYCAIVSVTAATAAIVIDGAVAIVALPAIARATGVTQSQSVMAVTLYQFLLAVSLIPMAALGERLGFRRVFRIGLGLFAASVLLCPMVQSFGQLLALRALQALGGALALSVGSAQIRLVYPSRQLGRGLALNSLTVALCTSLAPLLGAAILAIAPWPFVFASAAPPAIVALLASHALPADRKTRTRFDARSAALFALTMGLVFAALDSSLWPSQAIVLRSAAMLLASLGGWALVRRDNRRDKPLFPVDLLRRPLIVLSICGALCAFASSMAVLVILPFRLGEAHGLSTPAIASALAIWPLATMVAAPSIGLLSDRIAPWLLGSIGMTTVLVALCFLASAPHDAGLADLGWRLALCGAGFAAYTASNARLVLASAPRERSAAVGSLIATTRILGQSIGAIIAAAVLARQWAGAPAGLVIPLVLAGLALMLSLSRRLAA